MNSTNVRNASPVAPAANKPKPSFFESLFGAKPNAPAPATVGGRRKNRASRKDRKNRNAMSRKDRKNRNAMSRKNRNAMSRRNRH